MKSNNNIHPFNKIHKINNKYINKHKLLNFKNINKYLLKNKYINIQDPLINLKKKYPYLNNIKDLKKANKYMLDYFINCYFFDCRDSCDGYICYKYKNGYFEKYMLLSKKKCEEMTKLILKYGIFNIIDKDIFFNNDYIKQYYKEINVGNEHAYWVLKIAFDHLGLLQDFKELNEYLDKQYVIFTSNKIN